MKVIKIRYSTHCILIVVDNSYPYICEETSVDDEQYMIIIPAKIHLQNHMTITQEQPDDCTFKMHIK